MILAYWSGWITIIATRPRSGLIYQISFISFSSGAFLPPEKPILGQPARGMYSSPEANNVVYLVDIVHDFSTKNKSFFKMGKWHMELKILDPISVSLSFS